MASIIDMPKLSDTMTVGTLVKWLKKEGDSLQPGDMLAEVETDKATMEVENFEKGTLLKCYVEEGAQVAIGEPMCAIGKAGEAAPGPDAAQVAGSSSTQASHETSAPASAASSSQGQETQGNHASGRIKASPLARKLAKAQNISLERIQGTGPGGRIVKADILEAMRQAPTTMPKSAAMPQSAPLASTSAAPAAASIPASSSAQKIPVSGMRSTIARRLLESKTQIPHFYLEAEIDAVPLMELRTALNDKLSTLSDDAAKLSVNDFILKATAEALKTVPQINRSWAGDHIIQHNQVDLAFGVAIEDGLLTPVIRHADQKTLRSISSEAKSLISKARAHSLSAADMSGSTFTVTNLGMYAINRFYGIINPPNAGILSVGGVQNLPVLDATGAVVPGKRMVLGFSGDHRVIDGVLGAQFLNTLKQILEAPSLMLI